MMWGDNALNGGWNDPLREPDYSVFHSEHRFEGATAALSSAELPANHPYRTIQQAADDAPSFTPIESLKGPGCAWPSLAIGAVIC